MSDNVRSDADTALVLLEIIADAEKKILRSTGGKTANADRKWILDTYAECLRIIKNPSIRDVPVAGPILAQGRRPSAPT